MIIARFNCPACETPIEAPADSVARGVRCPQCDTGFVPGKVQTSDEAVAATYSNGAAMKVGPRIETMSREEAQALSQIQREQAAAKQLREERERKWTEYNRLKDAAESLTIVICVLAAIGFISLVVGAVSDDSPVHAIAFLIGGAAFSLLLTLFLIAQLIHIRAGLEKLSLKE
jgi:heme A synthase